MLTPCLDVPRLSSLECGEPWWLEDSFFGLFQHCRRQLVPYRPLWNRSSDRLQGGASSILGASRYRATAQQSHSLDHGKCLLTHRRGHARRSLWPVLSSHTPSVLGHSVRLTITKPRSSISSCKVPMVLVVEHQLIESSECL